MEKEDIMAEASCLVSDSRQQTYGDFWDNHRRIGVMWSEFLQLEEPIPAESVAIMMALMKISRLSHDSSHADNYIDAIAYLAGAAEVATS